MSIESAQEFFDKKQREKEERERQGKEHQAKQQERQTELAAVKSELPSLFVKIIDQLKEDAELLAKMEPPIQITIDIPTPEVVTLRRTFDGQLHILQIEMGYHDAWQAHTIVKSLITDLNGTRDELQIRRQGSDTVLQIGTNSYSFNDPKQLARAVGYLTAPLRGK